MELELELEVEAWWRTGREKERICRTLIALLKMRWGCRDSIEWMDFGFVEVYLY